MKTRHPMLRRFPIFLGMVLLFVACASVAPLVVREEPSVVPLSHGSRESATPAKGREGASIELTVQARTTLESGSVDEAVSMLEKAIALHPSNPYAYYFLAKARFARDEYPQALPLLGKAELYLQDNFLWLSWVHTLRGRTYEALFRPVEAKTEYQRAIHLDPGNLPAQEGLGRLSFSFDSDERGWS